MSEDICDNCAHPRRSHRWGGANAHASYTYLSSCRVCECDQYIDPDTGQPKR